MNAIRGRSLRNRNYVKARQSEEDVIRLDYRKNPGENLREILSHLVRSDVSKTKKLSYYNAYVRLRSRFGPSLDQSLTKEELLICLRHGLFSRAKEMRAACLRALRYFCHDWASVETILKLHIDYLIARSIDICYDNDIERVHALRLIRKIMFICPERFPSSLLVPMISVANDGAKQRDKLVRTCLATICELALQNACLVAKHGGIGTILDNILECHQLPRINESLMATIINLLNHPKTRHLVKEDVDLEKMLAPFTDFDYKYAIDTNEQSGEDSDFKYDACKMAIATIVKSWPGVIRFCKPDAAGLQSFIGMLYLPNMETRKEIMDVLFDVFRLSVPLWTDSFSHALVSIDPSEMNDTWKLTDGFVVEEGNSLLVHLARTRPNLVYNHIAVTLSAFISAGLLQALVETITTSNQYVSVRATILLGELLHLSNSILPDVTNHYHHCLPSLLERATDFQVTSSQQSQASLAIGCLAKLDAMKRRGLKPCSLYLDHLLHCVKRYHSNYISILQQQKNQLSHLDKDRDRDLINQALRDSQVLYTKDYHSWAWDLIVVLLKWQSDTLKRLEDQQYQRFVRRLVDLFKPSKKLFSTVEIIRDDAKKMTRTGLHLLDFLLESESAESHKNLRELLSDIGLCLQEVCEQKNSRDFLFIPSTLAQTCSQYYFLFIGRISFYPNGESLLRELNIYHLLMNLMCVTTHDTYIKLIVSSLDYTQNNTCKKILSSALTATSETARLYVTGFMRVLLRSRMVAFNAWGIEALVNQLYDQSKSVSMEALSILSEACEDNRNLTSLIKRNPSVDHIGEKGDLLIARFLSTELGFKILSEPIDSSDTNYIESQLDRWHTHFNYKYVKIVEERLTEALTTYEKTYDGSYVRRSHRRVPRKDVFVPVHLYGQLVQHEKGLQLLKEQPCLVDLIDTLRHQDLKIDEQLLKVKAALWALGHIGTSVWGVSFLQENNVIPMIIKLAEESGVFTIRGTSIYVLGLIACTSKGSDILHEFGWESVRHSHVRVGCHHNTADEIYSSDKIVLNVCHENINSDYKLTERISLSTAKLSPTEESSFFTIDDDAIPDAQSNVFGSCSSCPPGLSESAVVTNINELDKKTKNNAVMHLLSVEMCEVVEKNRVWDETIKGSSSRENCSLDFLQQQTSVHFHSTEVSNNGTTFADGDSPRPTLLLHDKNNCINHRTLNFSGIGVTSDGSHGDKSCSDTTDTAGTSGISSLESHRATPQKMSEPIITSSSLDTGRQSILNAESSMTMRRSANLRPIPSSNHNRSSSQPQTTSNEQNRQLYLTKDFTDQRLFTSSQDLEGYALLRGLKAPRAHSKDAHRNIRPASLLTNTYTSKTRSLDYRFSKARTSLRSLVPRVSFHERFISACSGMSASAIRTVSLEALDDDAPQSSVNDKTTAGKINISRTIPLESQDESSFSQFVGRPEYLGICVPIDISMIFQVNEGEDNRSQATQSDFQNYNNVDETSKMSRHNSVSMDFSLEHHDESKCIGCYRINITNGNSETKYNEVVQKTTDDLNVFQMNDSDVISVKSPSTLISSSRKCSLTEVPSGSSISSQTSAESVPIAICGDSFNFERTMIRKEVIRLVINLSSSVGVKSTEQGLLIMKQKFPVSFQDLCLYSDICYLLSNYSFRLISRRFIQELFQDLNFDPCLEDPQVLFQIPEEELAKFSSLFEMDHHLHQLVE